MPRKKLTEEEKAEKAKQVQTAKTEKQQKEQEKRENWEGSPPIRYVLQGTHGFVEGAPGKDQCVVYDLKTRLQAAILPSKQAAQAWADQENKKQRVEKQKEPRKP